MKANGTRYELYTFNNNDNHIVLDQNFCTSVRRYKEILIDEITLKWSFLCESWNNSPRIIKKIRMMSDQSLKRGSLKKYEEYLLLINSNRTCVHCNQLIKDKMHIDHVIPWSFLVSDDLWNLALSHHTCNIKKSNSPPSQNLIKKINWRNKKLLNLLSDDKSKEREELKLAIEQKLLDKFYFQFLG